MEMGWWPKILLVSGWLLIASTSWGQPSAADLRRDPLLDGSEDTTSTFGRSGDPALAAYVAATALNVREGVGTTTPLAGLLHKYDPVLITNHATRGGEVWFEIEAVGLDVQGWVTGKYLIRGAPPRGLHSPADYGARQSPTLAEGKFKYVGVAGCRPCHTESTGDFSTGAYRVWKSHPHASAYRVLSLGFTRRLGGRLRGIDEPDKDWRCLKCHVTAYGAPKSRLAKTYRVEDGVGCETCHGPGSAYAQENHGPDNPDREALGFVKLTNLVERKELCIQCHNPLSPTYKPFNTRRFSRDILHWADVPEAEYVTHAKQVAKDPDALGGPEAEPPTVLESPPPDLIEAIVAHQGEKDAGAPPSAAPAP